MEIYPVEYSSDGKFNTSFVGFIGEFIGLV